MKRREEDRAARRDEAALADVARRCYLFLGRVGGAAHALLDSPAGPRQLADPRRPKREVVGKLSSDEVAKCGLRICLCRPLVFCLGDAAAPLPRQSYYHWAALLARYGL